MLSLDSHLDAAGTRGVGPVGLADALGWASAALGLPMLAPGPFLRAIGARDDTRARVVTVAVGVRELIATATILGMRHRRVGVWSRVGGDVIDLTLLAAAWRRGPRQTERLLGAGAFVTAVLALDLVAAIRLSQAEGVGVSDGSDSHGVGAPRRPSGGPTHVRTAITVAVGEDQARRAFYEFQWSALDAAAAEAQGVVRFAAAPGDRGTELHVDYDPSVPGGGLGATALKLAGRAPDQRLNDELRQFKALVETGVVVRSDKTPEGPSARRQLRQKPGQPEPATGQAAGGRS